MALRSVRNLEVLDLSGNKVRRIATNPLRNLDWLVELKLDDNQICKVQGEPFSSMPRLKVLTMRNNRMVNIMEPTFRSLRANLAVLDLDGKIKIFHPNKLLFFINISLLLTMTATQFLCNFILRKSLRVQLQHIVASRLVSRIKFASRTPMS